jgi:GNAT superfamily N-acetyltransferase
VHAKDGRSPRLTTGDADRRHGSMTTDTPPHFHIRSATPDDAPVILALIRALAEYERAPAAAVATEAQIRETLFGPKRSAEAVLACEGEEPVGFAVFFHNYSTWLGRPGLYLEDLFVQPRARGRGYGRQLLAHLAMIAEQRGCARLEWQVLDWNAPAIGFYRALGAIPMDEWTVYRLTGPSLASLAAEGARIEKHTSS